MQRQIQITADGSATVAIPDWQVTYHSKHGSIQESRHVFIDAGLQAFMRSHPQQKTISIFEMGFGTGLNAWLSLEQAIQQQVKIHYTAIELYPLNKQEYEQLNYDSLIPVANHSIIELHEAAWETENQITSDFLFTKHHDSLHNYKNKKGFDIIFYDAFAPAAQPELWTTAVFEMLLNMTNPGGIFVTYCSKGDVRRSLISAGWQVEKLPGPKWKREMLRASKPAR